MNLVLDNGKGATRAKWMSKRQLQPVAFVSRYSLRALAVFCVLLGAVAGEAQEQKPSPQELLSAQWAQLARQVLAGQEMPRPDQLQRAAVLLDQALALAPQSQELWRQRADLASFQQDHEKRTAALRQYLALAPQDDVAQLQLIDTMLGRVQTLDGRLEQLGRMFEQGTALSPALRSRLATRAAAAASELGDDQGFARWLTQAVRLDPTNAQAASLLYELAESRGGSPLQRAAAALSWIRADPFAIEPRLALSQLLLGDAAYEQAARQFSVATSVQVEAPHPLLVRDWALAAGAAGRPTDALQILGNYQRFLQYQRMVERQAAGEQPQPDQPEEQVSLPLALEVVRLAVASDSDELRDQPQVQAVFQRVMDALGEAASQSAEGEFSEAALEAASVPPLFDMQVDRAAQMIEGLPADHPAVQRARGWVALRQGETGQARQLLEPLAETDPLALLGLALLHEPAAAERKEILQQVVQREPASLAALLATQQLRRQSAEVPMTPGGRALTQLMEREASKILEPDPQLIPWTSIRAERGANEYEYQDPMPVTLRLRNLSGLPLSLGDGGTLPSQAMLSISASVGGQQATRPPTTFVDLGRRLRLEPGEEVTVTVPLEQTPTGLVLDASPTQPVLLQVDAILDPRLSRGVFVPGPLGGRDTLTGMRRYGQPATADNVQLWLNQLRTASGTQEMVLLARLLRLGDDVPAAAGESVQQAAQAVSERFGELDPLAQAWTLLFLPAGDAGGASYQPLLQQAQRVDAAPVRLAYLSRHVTGPEDPVLLAAMRQEEAAVQQYARAVHQSLTTPPQAPADAPAEPVPAAVN